MNAQSVQYPIRCGIQQYHNAIIKKDSSNYFLLKQQREFLQTAANYYNDYIAKNGREKTTTVYAIPVIFHIILDSAQFYNIGGTTGIIKRCDSQIAVLNADFNKQNRDSNLIPTGWKSLYGNSRIKFALARTDPGGHCTPGYEVKIITGSTLTDAGFSDIDLNFESVKVATTGLPAWDVTKYYNVWCTNFTGSATNVLGLTLSPSSAGCLSCSPVNEIGPCILYTTLGSPGPTGSDSGTGYWYYPFNLGRTLTHETGHFFEIWHTWGDDSPGDCPWSPTGQDDGLNDTPPQADPTYGNPSYTVSGGTFNDGCQYHSSINTQPYGIACLSYMDYTDDNAMHLFTNNQASAMASMVLVPSTGGVGVTGFGMIGESYSLTQNPTLLICPSGITETEINSKLGVYPNPTTGEINITLNPTAETLNKIVLLNLLGTEVLSISGNGKDYYSLNISTLPKGIYVLHCNFQTGTVTRKIVLQ